MLFTFNCIILLQNLLQICRKTHKKCFRIRIVKPWRLFFSVHSTMETPIGVLQMKNMSVCVTHFGLLATMWHLWDLFFCVCNTMETPLGVLQMKNMSVCVTHFGFLATMWHLWDLFFYVFTVRLIVECST
jgi:hypothetical protein